MSDLFVDRPGNIVIRDGVARFDFLRLSALDSEKTGASWRRSRPRIHPLVPN